MKITEKDIEKLKRLDSLRIRDKKDFFWKIDINANRLEVSYGTVQNPLNYKKIECPKRDGSFHAIIERLLGEAKNNFESKVNNEYMKFHYGNN